jgi:hypothetical protein
VTIDWFLLFLATITVLRGLGAGVILGIVLITLPVRKRVGLIPYAQFTRTLYREWGVGVYGALTVLGALLTLAIAIWTFTRGEPAIVSWSIVASLVATSLGLIGTGGAFPTMRTLWETSDNDASLVAGLLDRFASWGVFSAVWHIAAFLVLMVALART